MTFRSTDPHSPERVLGTFEEAGPDGVDEAVATVRAAQPAWAATPAPRRAAALDAIAAEVEQAATELADLMVHEVGKPATEARGEVARTVGIFRYFAQQALAPEGETYPSADGRSWLLTRRRPRGVCALVTPWNFPLAIPSWKAAPALGFGNGVVLKPAPQAAATAEALVGILRSHLPDGVVAVVHGDAETGAFLVSHPEVAAVSFTGSVEAGHEVAGRAAGRGAAVQCEMGGQNPSIVLADADPAAAAATIAQAAYGYAGQKCTATSRVIVEAPLYDELRDALVEAIAALPAGDPADEATMVGPVIEQEALDAALGALERTGGTVLAGGARGPGPGYHLQPTLVEVADPRDVLAQEEVFAPVAALLRASSADEAVALANGVRYGLVAAVFTRDLGAALPLMTRLEAGLVRTNAPTSGVDLHAPFGGSKASSIGPREQGPAARDLYTESRTITLGF